MLENVLGADEGREGGRVHKSDAAHVHDDGPDAVVVGGALDGALDLRGGVEVHLAAHGYDGVVVGVVVYADLEVRADPPLWSRSVKPTDINASVPPGKPPFLSGSRAGDRLWARGFFC